MTSTCCFNYMVYPFCDTITFIVFHFTSSGRMNFWLNTHIGEKPFRWISPESLRGPVTENGRSADYSYKWSSFENNGNAWNRYSDGSYTIGNWFFLSCEILRIVISGLTSWLYANFFSSSVCKPFSFYRVITFAILVPSISTIALLCNWLSNKLLSKLHGMY